MKTATIFLTLVLSFTGIAQNAHQKPAPINTEVRFGPLKLGDTITQNEILTDYKIWLADTAGNEKQGYVLKGGKVGPDKSEIPEDLLVKHVVEAIGNAKNEQIHITIRYQLPGDVTREGTFLLYVL